MEIRTYHLHLMEDSDTLNPYPSARQVRAAACAVGALLQKVHCQKVDKPVYTRPYDDTEDVCMYDKFRGRGVLIDKSIGPVPTRGVYLLSLDVMIAGDEVLLEKLVRALDKEVRDKTDGLSMNVTERSVRLRVPDDFYLAYNSVKELLENTGVVFT